MWVYSSIPTNGTVVGHTAVFYFKNINRIDEKRASIVEVRSLMDIIKLALQIKYVNNI